MLCRTLLLDDEPNVVAALRRELLRKPDIGHDGIEIASFTSPREALEYIAGPQGAIDLAIVDYRMPGMDGVRFLTELKNLQPDAVRILLTGDADCAAAIKAINAASVDCLVLKPWHEYDLKGRIALALHQHALQGGGGDRRGPAPRPPPPPRPAAWRLMLVDDEPAVLNALEREIGGGALSTFVITSHTSAADALKVAAVACPDLVIADQVMPGIDGVTFFHRLRALCPNAVRIMLSGRADLGMLADAINIAGVYHFLGKPWAPAELRVMLAQALVYRDILIQRNIAAGASE